MPGPPVARIEATSGWFIKIWVAWILGLAIKLKAPEGRPASTPAFLTHSKAATEHFCAFGWKAKIIGLRVLIAIRDLNKVVEVGLVTGVTPAKTPSGSAILTNSCSSSFSMTPTVFSFLIWCQISSVANIFLIALSS